MAAVAQIVLADAQATPVNHTFIPLGPDTNGVWWYEDQSRPSPIGFWKVSISLTRPKAANRGTSSTDRVSRVKVGMYMPQLETLGNNSSGLTPSPTVAYVLTASVQFTLPERSTLQDRKDLRKFVPLVMADAAVIAAVESLQGIF